MPVKKAAKAAPKKAVPAGGYSIGRGSSPTDLVDVELPSGNICQARRPGVQGLIGAGLLDSLDELTALVQTEHIDPKTPSGMAAAQRVTAKQAEDATQALLADKDKLETAFTLIDRITAYVVVQPPVWVDYKLKVSDPGQESRIETDDEFNRREEAAAKAGAIAVREVDDEDKMFLLQWCVGGTSDLAGFRPGR